MTVADMSPDWETMGSPIPPHIFNISSLHIYKSQKSLENSDLQQQQQVHFLYFVWFCIFSEFSLSKAEIKG